MSLVGRAPAGSVAAENIRHLQDWSRHCRVSGRRCHLHVQKFKRALDLPDGVDGHTCIAGGRRNVTMAEQILNHVNVDTLLQKMGREAVPQRVNSDGLVETCGLSGGATDAL